MRRFKIVPEITRFDAFSEFLNAFEVGKNDLILSERAVLHSAPPDCEVIYQEDYGRGEPTMATINAVIKAARGLRFDRVIGIGGGSALDTAKLLALDTSRSENIEPYFKKELPANRARKLILVPTTCGTGSEVTNISVAADESKNIKLGLACDALFADGAALVTELVSGLPESIFLTSSMDALIHAVESFLSPRASYLSKMFSEKAAAVILAGYAAMSECGADGEKRAKTKASLCAPFLEASNCAGIAFSNAGCGLIHAMSYPLGGKYHIPHGRANHMLLGAALRFYAANGMSGELEALCESFDRLTGGSGESGERGLNAFLTLTDKMIERKPLSSYGMTESDCRGFAQYVETSQRRLTSNAYRPATTGDMTAIYKSLL